MCVVKALVRQVSQSKKEKARRSLVESEVFALIEQGDRWHGWSVAEIRNFLPDYVQASLHEVECALISLMKKHTRLKKEVSYFYVWD